MMNRRNFLSMVGLVAPAIIVRPKYFFAPVQGWGPIPTVPVMARVARYDDYLHVSDFTNNDPLPGSPVDLIGSMMSYRMAFTIDRIVRREAT